MKIVILFIISGLICFLIGLSLANRIADHKIKVMRLEAGLDINLEDREEGNDDT